MFSFIKNKLKEIFYLDEPEPIDVEKGCRGLESTCKFSGNRTLFWDWKKNLWRVSFDWL